MEALSLLLMTFFGILGVIYFGKTLYNFAIRLIARKEKDIKIWNKTRM